MMVPVFLNFPNLLLLPYSAKWCHHVIFSPLSLRPVFHSIVKNQIYQQNVHFLAELLMDPFYWRLEVLTFLATDWIVAVQQGHEYNFH